MHRHEIHLSAAMLAVIPSSSPDPESLMIEAEERESESLQVVGQKRRVRPRFGFMSLRSPKLLLVLEKFLPVEESFLMQAYYLHSVPQATLAEQFGVAQPSISYRLKRANERIRWAMGLETWWHSASEIRANVSSALPHDSVEVLASLWANRFNQSRTADALGIGTMTVKDWIVRTLPVLGLHSGDDRVAPYARDLKKVVRGAGWSMGTVKHGRMQMPTAA